MNDVSLADEKPVQYDALSFPQPASIQQGNSFNHLKNVALGTGIALLALTLFGTPASSSRVPSSSPKPAVSSTIDDKVGGSGSGKNSKETPDPFSVGYANPLNVSSYLRSPPSFHLYALAPKAIVYTPRLPYAALRQPMNNEYSYSSPFQKIAFQSSSRPSPSNSSLIAKLNLSITGRNLLDSNYRINKHINTIRKNAAMMSRGLSTDPSATTPTFGLNGQSYTMTTDGLLQKNSASQYSPQQNYSRS